MAKARIASKTQSKLGMLLFGEQGSGKSTLASQLTYFKRPDGKPFRVLYIDPESGSIDDYLEGIEMNGVNLDNLYIVYTQSLGEVREYISKIKNNENFYVLDENGNETEEIVVDAEGNPFRADAIVIDGCSILNLTVKQGLIDFSKKRNAVKAKKEGLIGEEKLVKVEGANLELKDYQVINFKGQDLILDLMASGVHYVVTARETDEKSMIKDKEGKVANISTGRKVPDGFKDMSYNVKTEARTYTNEDGIVCLEIIKDRTGTHQKGEVIEDPSLLDWQIVIDKTANNKSYVIKNDLTQAVETEQKIFTKEILNITGDVDVPETEENSVEDIKSKISAIQKTLSPVDKPKAKAALTEKGLPVAIKSVTDINILIEIFNTLEEFSKS